MEGLELLVVVRTVETVDLPKYYNSNLELENLPDGAFGGAKMVRNCHTCQTALVNH